MGRILKIEASKTGLQIDVNGIYQQRENPGEKEELIFEKVANFRYVREMLNTKKNLVNINRTE